MGKDFYEASELSRSAYEESAKILDMDIQSICFEENDLLNRTDYTQAALVTTCLAMTREIEKQGLTPDMTAGLSLGEYCAIVAAGGMSYEDAVKTIWKRGCLMHNAVPDGSGGMAAVLGLSGEQVKAVTDGVENVIRRQLQLSGTDRHHRQKGRHRGGDAGVKRGRCQESASAHVSGPFHSPFLKQAGEELYETLEKVDWKPRCRSVCDQRERGSDHGYQPDQGSAPGHRYPAPSCGSRVVRRMIKEGVDIFVEIGPGKTLSGFITRDLV